MIEKSVKRKKKIEIQGIPVEVEKKQIKNIYLRIKAPRGDVYISVPHQVDDKAVEKFITERMEWICKHREAYLKKPQQKELQYIAGEILYIWGEAVTLDAITISHGISKAIDTGDRLTLYIQKNSTVEQRKKIVNNWYREHLKIVIPELIRKWEPVIGVHVEDWNIKDMKTRWGTCNVVNKKIWISLQLAKKSPEHVEYVVVHELVHLLEASHNERFKNLMSHFLPEWAKRKKELNEK